jgi:hypothetical protein
MLKNKARGIVREHGFEGLTSRKLAAALGIPLDEVAWQIRKDLRGAGGLKELKLQIARESLRGDDLPLVARVMQAGICAVPLDLAVAVKEHTPQYLDPCTAGRKGEVFKAATGLIKKHGLRSATLSAVAKEIGKSKAHVHATFGSITAMRDAVVDFAIRTHDIAVIARALEDRHPSASALPKKIQDEALKKLDEFYKS